VGLISGDRVRTHGPGENGHPCIAQCCRLVCGLVAFTRNSDSGWSEMWAAARKLDTHLVRRWRPPRHAVHPRVVFESSRTHRQGATVSTSTCDLYLRVAVTRQGAIVRSATEDRRSPPDREVTALTDALCSRAILE